VIYAYKCDEDDATVRYLLVVRFKYLMSGDLDFERSDSFEIMHLDLKNLSHLSL
jgi:hypothetical protein